MVACETSDSDLTKLAAYMHVEHRPQGGLVGFRRHQADDALVRRRHFLEIQNYQCLRLAIAVAS